MSVNSFYVRDSQTRGIIGQIYVLAGDKNVINASAGTLVGNIMSRDESWGRGV